MKKFLLLLLLLTSILLCSCRSYRDLDKLLFITSIIVDASDDGHPKLYFEAIKPVRSPTKETKEEKRILYSLSDRTISEAVTRLNTSSGTRVTFAHNKIILFTKKAAEQGLENYIDIFDRGQEFLIRALIGIYDGSVEEYEKLDLHEDKQVGLFIFELLNSSSEMTSKGVRIDIKEFFNQKIIGDKTNSLPIIVIKSEKTRDRIDIDGIALIKENKLIGTLVGEQPFYFNFMLDNPSFGILKAQNPIHKDKLVTLKVLKYKFKSDLDFDGDTLHVKDTMNIKTTVREVQGGITLDKNTLQEIKKDVEEKTKNECYKLFSEYKEKGIDIFDIQEKFERKYPKYKGLDIITKTDLDLKVNIDIEGTTDTFDLK